MSDEERRIIAHLREIEHGLNAYTAREEKAVKLIFEGLSTDGGHHKQWFLHKLLRLFRPGELTESLAEFYDPGIAP